MGNPTPTLGFPGTARFEKALRDKQVGFPLKSVVFVVPSSTDSAPQQSLVDATGYHHFAYILPEDSVPDFHEQMFCGILPANSCHLSAGCLFFVGS